MSRKYSFKDLLEHVRLIAITFAIGGIAMYVLGLLTVEALGQSMAQTAFLLLSAVTLAAFVLISALLLAKLGFVGWKQKFIHRPLFGLALFGSVVSLFLYMFTTDISFGSSIRSMFGLPDGNWFIEGGVVGWTLVFLLVVIGFALTDLKSVFGKVKMWLNREMALPDRKKPVAEAQKAPTVYDQEETKPFPAQAPVQEGAYIGTSVFDQLGDPMYDSANRG